MTYLLALALHLVPTSATTLSRLPDRPPGGSVLNPLFHQLETLAEAHGSRLNPDDAEHFTYRGVAAFTRESSVTRDAVAAAYEALRSDYLALADQPEVLNLPEHRWPIELQLRLSIAGVIRDYTLQVRPVHADVLTIVHKTLWDHRHVYTFFVPIVSRDHRPLHSLGSLAANSRRAALVIERIEDDLARRLATAELLIGELGRLVGGSDLATHAPAVHRSVEDLVQFTASFKERVGNLTERLYSGVQHANDLVLGRVPTRRFAQLDEEMRKLGEGLRVSLEIVSTYADIRAGGRTRRERIESDGIELSPVNHDLTKLLGWKLASGRPEPASPRETEVYAMYADGLLVQYVMAAGAAMAALRQTAEVRGGPLSRLTQEIRYQRARIGGSKSDPAPVASGELTTFKGRAATVPAVDRRGFLGQAASARAEALEDRLWTTFFAAAKLDEDSFATRACIAQLTEGVAAGTADDPAAESLAP